MSKSRPKRTNVSEPKSSTDIVTIGSCSFVGDYPVCRICLKTCSSTCMSIFEPYKDTCIAQFIVVIADFKIVEGDGLPSKICKACLVDFETVLNFTEKCKNSNDCLTKGINPNIPIIKKIKKEETEFDETQVHYNDTTFDENSLDTYDIINNDNLIVEIEGDSEIKAVIKEIKSVSQGVQCDDCGEMFKSKCKLRVHWKNDHLKKTRDCKFCKRLFKSLLTYNKHMKENETKPCINLEHVVVEGEGKGRIFHCAHCDYMTLVLRAMNMHTLTHTGVRPYKCKLCDGNFTQQSSLINHNEIVHKRYRVETTCDYCGKFLQGRNRIYRHLQRHREANNKYQCDICKIYVSSKKGILAHLQRHSGVKAYTCEICAKSFYTASELCTHRRIRHTTINPEQRIYYQCKVCAYKTHRKHHFQKHEIKHTDSNVACSTCGWFFNEESELKKHLKKHFGDRPFPCLLCESRFLDKKALYKHIAGVHRGRKKKHNKTKQESSPADS